MTPERKVKARVEAILREAGAYYFFPATHGYGRSGVPDIVACINGGFLGIECKSGAGKATALQMRELDRVRAAGGTALLVNEETLYAVYDVVKAMRERQSRSEP